MGNDLVMPLGTNGLAPNPQYPESGSVAQRDTYSILVKVMSMLVPVSVISLSMVTVLAVVSMDTTLVSTAMPVPETRCPTANPVTLVTVMTVEPRVILATA